MSVNFISKVPWWHIDVYFLFTDSGTNETLQGKLYTIMMVLKYRKKSICPLIYLIHNNVISLDWNKFQSQLIESLGSLLP